MKNIKIVLIGDSPAIYVCGIYLYTANVKPLIIRKDLGLEYECTVLPGLRKTKAEYVQSCYEQAYNMKIEIQDAKQLKIESIENDKFRIEYDGKMVEADIVVSDVSLGIEPSKSVYIVEDRLLANEGIVLGGEGCAIAFEIKDILNE